MLRNKKSKKKLEENEKNMNSKVTILRKETGITLVALVITTIVLIILAVVAINMVFGDNGILMKAQKANEKTKEATEDELRKLTQAEAGTYIEDYEYIDNSTGEEKIITIPAQCAVSQVEGENSLKEGLVIIDVNGNEWVWIEVPRSIEVYKTAGTMITDFSEENLVKIYNDLKEYTIDYKNDSYTDTWYSYDEYHIEETQYNELKKTMLRNIYLNQGFWIGRFEAGIESRNRSFIGENNQEHSITDSFVIKKNVYVYNWITAYQAQELCSKMKIGNKTISLMFGLQWDLVLKYLETNGIDASNLKVDSSSWGNYKNSSFQISKGRYSSDLGVNFNSVLGIFNKASNVEILFTTGISDRNCCKNIYDLAGNVFEWTLERENVQHNIETNAVRGGGFNNDGINYNVDTRLHTNYYFTNHNIGFRPTIL